MRRYSLELQFQSPHDSVKMETLQAFKLPALVLRGYSFSKLFSPDNKRYRSKNSNHFNISKPYFLIYGRSWFHQYYYNAKNIS
jgi:hypothetical protein